METARTPNPKLFVALVHETLKAESFDSLGELAEAVKTRAARLKIPYDGDLVWDAIEQVTRGGKVGIVAAREGVTPQLSAPTITRGEARAICAQLRVTPRTMD